MNFLKSKYSAPEYMNSFQESIFQLKQHARDFSELLEQKGISYVLIGGTSLSFYNCSRGTEDLDFIVDCKPEELRSKLYSKVKFFSDRRAIFIDKKIPVDFIYVGDKNGSEKVSLPSFNRINNINVVSLPALIDLKLIAHRNKDIGDIQELIRNNKLPVGYRRNSKYTKEYIEIWHNTIKLSQDEIDRQDYIRRFK